MSADPDGACLLSLVDGTQLALRAEDGDAGRVVEFLARTARLAAAPHPLPEGARQVHVMVGDGAAAAQEVPAGEALVRLEPTDVQRLRGRSIDAQGRAVSLYEQLTPQHWLWAQLMRLSAAIGRETGARGGVLLHGGLAEWDAPAPCGRGLRGDGRRGTGVLIGGRSGIGKTTASLRLRPPWRSLADDVTLVVRDGLGVYWAHPWPTWSRLLGEDVRHPDGGWDVQRAVPLRGLFFLEQAPTDRVEAIGPGQAVCRLAMLAEQASRQQFLRRPVEEMAALNVRRFENLCSLAKALPAFVLHVSLDGAFWQEMEQALHLRAGE